MGTTLIEPRKNGSSLKGLTDQQRVFVKELLADDEFSPTNAARKAGYSNPSQAANKLLKKKEIRAALGKAQREREERCDLKGDDVLNYLRAGLFFNPLHYFKPSPDGGWLIDDPDNLPEEVGRLIEEIEVKVVESPDGGTHSKLKVKLVSKSTLLPLAMKHLGLLTEKLQLDANLTHSVDWDEYYDASDSGHPDLLEVKLNGNGNGKAH